MSWYCSYCPGDRIVIHASKLATCIGENPFENRNAYIAEFQGEPYEVWDEKEITKLSKGVQDHINTIRETSFENATQVVHSLASLEDVPVAVKTQITKEVFCKHGIEKETVALPKSAKTCKRYKISEYPIITTHDLEVYIGGKHDGLKEKEQTIVEIKTRQYKFLGVREYERVQVHAYMYIYGVKKAELIENYNGELKVHDIHFDEAFWNIVKEKLYEFLASFLL